MFTQPVFIRRNTPELRKKLEELGYELPSRYKQDGNELQTYMSGIASSNINEEFTNNIYCGTNEQLFLALAALNDHDDYMQWMINNKTGNWFLCHERAITRMLGGGAELYHRKATPTELIEYFKTE